MIKILYRKDIDTTVWDAFIEKSIQRNLYGLSFYLDIVPQPWGSVIKFDANMNYIAVLPFQIRSKYGIKMVHHNPITNELGCYSLTESFTDDLLEALQNEFRIIANYKFNFRDQFKNNPLEFEVTYHLDLSRTYQTIFEEYNADRKRNLRHVKKANLSIDENGDIDLLLIMFRENVAHKIYGLKSYQYKLIEELYTEAKKREMAFILDVKTEQGEILSSALFIQCFDRLIYFFSASTAKGKKLSSQTLLLDYVIKKFSQQSFILDFEHGSISGIGYFYSSFGAEQLKIYSLSERRIPPLVKSILSLRAKIVKGVYTLIGSH